MVAAFRERGPRASKAVRTEAVARRGAEKNRGLSAMSRFQASWGGPRLMQASCYNALIYN